MFFDRDTDAVEVLRYDVVRYLLVDELVLSAVDETLDARDDAVGGEAVSVQVFVPDAQVEGRGPLIYVVGRALGDGDEAVIETVKVILVACEDRGDLKTVDGEVRDFHILYVLFVIFVSLFT